jgi:hypothetical protein
MNNLFDYLLTSLSLIGKYKLIVIFILIAVFISLSKISSNKDFEIIAGQAWSTYSLAQKKYQNDLAGLIVRSDMRFKNIAIIQRGLQLAYINKRTLQFYYLLNIKPKVICLSEGVSAFANFPWEENDTKTLGNSNPEFAKLLKEIETLKNKNKDENLMNSLRIWFRDTCSASKDYKKILEALHSGEEETEIILKRYKQ